MPGAVHGGDAHIHTGAIDSNLLHRDIFNGQFGAAAARRGSFDNSAVYHNSAKFTRHVRTAAGRGELFVAVFHGEPGPGVVHANVGYFWRQPGPGDEVPVACPELPEGVVPVHDNHGYYHLLPRQGAGRGEAHLLPDGVGAVYDNYGHRVLQLPRPGVGRGEVLVNLLTDAAGAVYGPGNFVQEGNANIGTGFWCMERAKFALRPSPYVEYFILEPVIRNEGSVRQSALCVGFELHAARHE